MMPPRSLIYSHPRGPFEKPEKVAAIFPRKTEKHLGRDFLRVPAPICFDSPPQVRTSPRPQAVAFARPPQEYEHYFSALFSRGRGCFRRRLRRSVVSAARPNRRGTVTLHLYFDLPVGSIQSRVCGRIRQQILVADLMR